MAHNDFVRPSGIWANEMVPGASDYQRWDVLQSKALNGASGGGYAPTTPIILGGSGGQFASPNSSFSGGLRTQTGGRLILGTFDIPALSPPRTRKIVMDLLGQKPIFAQDLFSTPKTPGGSLYQSFPDSYEPAIPPPQRAGMGAIGISDAAQPAYFPVPRQYLHMGPPAFFPSVGAQLSAITLNFSVVFPPTPAQLAALIAHPWQLTLANPLGVSDATSTPLGALQLLNNGRFVPGFFYPGQWQRRLTVTEGQYVMPAYDNAAGSPAYPGQPTYYFRALSNGVTSSFAFPTWDFTPGSTTPDGTVTWICIGQAGMLQPTDAQSYYNGGNPQSLRMDLDLSLGVSQSLVEQPYYVALDNLPASAIFIYHSVVFEFANISSMYWA